MRTDLAKPVFTAHLHRELQRSVYATHAETRPTAPHLWTLHPSLQSIGLYQLAPGNPLAFWAGDFFVFSATGASDVATGLPLSDVVRFHPSDNSSAIVGQLAGIELGAAVSTCAPLR
jgi:hypothetical protein